MPNSTKPYCAENISLFPKNQIRVVQECKEKPEHNNTTWFDRKTETISLCAGWLILLSVKLHMKENEISRYIKHGTIQMYRLIKSLPIFTKVTPVYAK